jgi:hypothetical protein
MPNLNRSYVLQPFQDLIAACRNNVLLGLRLMETMDTFPGPTAEETRFFQLLSGEPPDDLGRSKAIFRRWIILKGLGDIHSCIGATLQRFIIFKTIDAEVNLNSTLAVDARESEIRDGVRGIHYPELIRRANLLSIEPLMLQDKIATFNNARNCLAHAGGIVTKRFCNSPQKDKLVILGRRFKLFFKRGEEEVLAQIGRPGPENAALMLGAEDFEIELGMDHPIELSLKNFLDILNTCVFFRADIEEKLAP